MSITSGSGAVHLTDDVQEAVKAISRRYDLKAQSDTDSASFFVPFCTLKFVKGSQSTLTVDVVSTIDTDRSSGEATIVPATWDSLVASLPSDQCRMAVAQVPWRAQSDGVVRTRLIFLLWAPDGTSVKERMVASMFSKGVKRLVDQWGAGMSLPVQAASVSDLSLADVEDKIRAKATVK